MKKSVSIVMVAWIMFFAVSLAGAQQEGRGREGQRGRQADVGMTRNAERDAKDSNSALNRMERTREREAKAPKERVDEKKKAMKETSAEAKEKGKEAVEKKGAALEKAGKGKEHQQQLQAKEKQLLHEKSKHLTRVAKLNRIRELAEKKGDTKTVQRVDKLLKREKERFGTKQGSIEGKVKKTGQAELKEKEDKVNDVNKK